VNFRLFILCFLELLLISYLRNVAGPLWSPVIFVGVSIAIAFIYLTSDGVSTVNEGNGKHKIPELIPWLLFAALSVIVFVLLKKHWESYAINMLQADRSDIIPQIMFLVRRLLAGQHPYAPITAWGYTLFPTYLPLQWLPYVFAEWLHIDYRIIPAAALWLVCLYFFIKNKTKDPIAFTAIWQLLVPVYPLTVWLVLVKKYDPYVYATTVEALIAAYYLFAATQLVESKKTLLALGIALCLFSRYSIVFWVPLCMLIMWSNGQKKNVFIVLVTIAAFFMACYWLPFLSKDPSIFIKGYQYHTVAALKEWTANSKYLNNGLGFTAWAYQYIGGSIEHRLSVYQNIHLIISIITIMVLALYYAKTKKKYTAQKFLLFSLKIYTCVFYAFIQIPYGYLYIVPVILSATLLMAPKNQGS